MVIAKQKSSWEILLIGGGLLAIHAIVIALPGNDLRRGEWSDFLAAIIDVFAAVVFFTAAWRWRLISRRVAWVWCLLGIAQIFSGIGDGINVLSHAILQIGPTRWVADLFYLLFYPAFFLGVIWMPSRKVNGYEWVKTILDMVILLLAITLGVWNFLFAPFLNKTGGFGFSLIFNIIYPLADLCLLATIILLVYRYAEAHEKGSYVWLIFGSLMTIGADLIYASLTLHGHYQSGSWVALVYSIGKISFVAAGLAQLRLVVVMESVKGEGQPKDATPNVRGWLRNLAYVGLGLAYLLLLYRNFVVLPMSMTEISLFVGVMVVLIVIRQLLSLTETRNLDQDLRHAHAKVCQQTLALEQANQAMQAEIQLRQQAEERLSHDALHDALTGLPNRVLFLDRLAHALTRQKRDPGERFAVLFLDLDSFKMVNDSLGHSRGDALLVQVAQILQEGVRSADTVARLGGDEFVILLENVHQADDAAITADRVQRALNNTIELAGMRIFVSVSIGIVPSIAAYELAEDVLRDADLAMYQAKSHGKAHHEVFSDGMRSRAINRLRLENDMRRGIEENAFFLHYQPILSIPEQRVVGFEALVRWQHPQQGLLNPADFIPIAEETGLIVPIGKWVLRESCLQAVKWQKDRPGRAPLRINVNVSGQQLQQADFVAMVTQILEETQLPAECLALEVTESVCLNNLESVAQTLRALQQLGVETQIDDFGTGYSSLSYLQHLPVSAIKIDRSFIQSIGSLGEDTPDFVRAIFAMIHGLGISAVAEGIETEAQLNALKQMECSFVQGFLLARPMETACVAPWMAKNTCEAEKRSNDSCGKR